MLISSSFLARRCCPKPAVGSTWAAADSRPSVGGRAGGGREGFAHRDIDGALFHGLGGVSVEGRGHFSPSRSRTSCPTTASGGAAVPRCIRMAEACSCVPRASPATSCKAAGHESSYCAWTIASSLPSRQRFAWGLNLPRRRAPLSGERRRFARRCHRRRPHHEGARGTAGLAVDVDARLWTS
jgi:hypothetical protein